jgi:hypothetical protein
MLNLNHKGSLHQRQNNLKAEDQTTIANSIDQRINPFQDNHQNKINNHQ